MFNAVNLDVYHYAGQNPVKLTDPDGKSDWILQIMTGLWNGDYSPIKSRVEYETKAAMHILPRQAEATTAGIAAGMLNAITGLQIITPDDYKSMGIEAEYAQQFADGMKVGEGATTAVLYANVARTVFQKTGQKISKEFFKEICSDKKTFAVFMKGFSKATAQGALPAITKTKFSSDIEKVGYVIGTIINYESAKEINKKYFNKK